MFQFLPAICIAQYAVPTSFGGCGGCPTPICQQRSACPPSPVPFCPPPPPCPPQFILPSTSHVPTSSSSSSLSTSTTSSTMTTIQGTAKEMVDLTANTSIIDSGFDGYKLSLDQLPLHEFKLSYNGIYLLPYLSCFRYLKNIVFPDDLFAVVCNGVDEIILFSTEDSRNSWVITSTLITLCVKEIVLLDGTLGGVAQPDESTWIITDRNTLEVTIFKHDSSVKWEELVVGDKRGRHEIDPDIIAKASELLERFTSENKALGASGTQENFNSSQLEECDIADDELSSIYWLHGDKQLVTKQVGNQFCLNNHNCNIYHYISCGIAQYLAKMCVFSFEEEENSPFIVMSVCFQCDVTGHQLLFVSRSHPNETARICLRLDVDGLLWTIDGEVPVHQTTFNAFGYVQHVSTISYCYFIDRQIKSLILRVSMPLNHCVMRYASIAFVGALDSDFPLENCPYGVFSTKDNEEGAYGSMLELSWRGAKTIKVGSETRKFLQDGDEMMSMEAAGNSFQYADLNIRHTGNVERTLAMVKRAVKMGYDAVVINIDIGDIAPDEFVVSMWSSSSFLCEWIAREQTIPNPFLVNPEMIDTSGLENLGKKFRQFSQNTWCLLYNQTTSYILFYEPMLIVNRITFTLNDASVIHNVFHNPKLKLYDLVAVRPHTEAILNTLTRKTDAIDIITMDPSNKVLHNGRLMLRSLRGRGIVVCSQAESVIDLRAPIDVMNMLTLWGVSGADARPMISGYARQVLLRAEARRTVRGALHVTPVEVSASEENEKCISAKIPVRSRTQKEALTRYIIYHIFSYTNFALSLPSINLIIFYCISNIISFLISEPSEKLKQALDADSLKKLAFLRKEIELISRLSRHFPSKITDDNWVVLLNYDWERRRSWCKVAHAHQLSDGPSLAVDCRFLPLLSHRAAELTTIQLKFLVSTNRDRRHLSMLDSRNSSSPVTSSSNYVDLFPKEKIIYLSPNAEEDLEEILDDHVYVIGGIVDRVPEKKIDRHASLVTAKLDGVRSARLPLDRYIKIDFNIGYFKS
uniref:SAM-dependent MTase TRM10-type domain-containing protein n=1 Tax=Heterorhabditis bacteriophora TaxID=37862 RepID=A0A1I7X5B8_HETBA